jgi:hypothetical protein
VMTSIIPFYHHDRSPFFRNDDHPVLVANHSFDSNLLRKRSQSRSTTGRSAPLTPSVMSPSHNRHPIKAFYTARTPLQSLLAFPGQILFAIAGLMGFAHYARQIVHITPRPGARIGSSGEKEVGFSEWVKKNVPSLDGAFVPTWWLPRSVETRAQKLY